jgi:hypothetical protein
VAGTLATVTPAAAEEPGATAKPPSDRWTVTVAPYLWLAAMDGHAAVAGIKSDVDVPVQDVLKDLSFGAMLAVDVEQGRFGIGLNGLFARVSPDSKVGDIKIDVTSDSGQLAILPFYRLLEWQYGVSSSGAPLRLVVAPEPPVFRSCFVSAEVGHDAPRSCRCRCAAVLPSILAGEGAPTLRLLRSNCRFASSRPGAVNRCAVLRARRPPDRARNTRRGGRPTASGSQAGYAAFSRSSSARLRSTPQR